jgi:hypothetical protein
MNTFNDLARHLNQAMTEQYIAVDQQQNPIARSCHQADFSQLLYVIRQYSIFPKELVSFTKSAKKKALQAGWRDVARELQDNIAEELGSSTGGISHYELLAGGLEEGLNLPIKNTKPSPATVQLLKQMQKIFSQEAAYVFGAMYAIEATSIAELTIVIQMIQQLLKGDLPHNLRYFFDMHLNEWEPEHEEDLRRSLAKFIKSTSFHQFEAGFCAVMEAMDLWWTELALESGFQVGKLEVRVA